MRAHVIRNRCRGRVRDERVRIEQCAEGVARERKVDRSIRQEDEEEGR